MSYARRSRGVTALTRRNHDGSHDPFPAAVLTAFTLYALYALAPAPIGRDAGASSGRLLQGGRSAQGMCLSARRGGLLHGPRRAVRLRGPPPRGGCAGPGSLLWSSLPWWLLHASAFTAGRPISAAQSIASAGADPGADRHVTRPPTRHPGSGRAGPGGPWFRRGPTPRPDARRSARRVFGRRPGCATPSALPACT